MTRDEAHMTLYRLAFKLQEERKRFSPIVTLRFDADEASKLADALAIAVTAPWMLVPKDEQEGGTAGE